MSVEKIIADWKKGIFKPIYWLEGEEGYHIDKGMEYAEKQLLPEADSAFNLTVFYGKDAAWAEVLNACRRYPMFSDRQVVLLKEAQQMKDIEKLEPYIENPSLSTILVVAYKDKKLDARKKFAKLMKEKAVMVSTKKMNERELPGWTQELLRAKGLTIQPKALAIMGDHIGNDLSRIDNEIEKIRVNLGTRSVVTEDDIEEFIGVTKEFNVFELQSAIAKADLARTIRIIGYAEANPKAMPIQMILPSLYSFFSKVFMIFGLPGQDEKSIAAAIGIPPFFIKDYMQAARQFGYTGIERALLLLHQYNLKSIGVNDAGTGDASLLREMAVKMLAK